MLNSRSDTATRRVRGGFHARMENGRAPFTGYSTELEDAMAFQSAPEIAEAVIRQTYYGVDLVNVVNFQLVGGYDQADIDSLATQIDAGWSANMLPLQWQELEYIRTDVRGLALQEDAYSAASAGSGSGGVTTGTPYPANVAFCVKFVTEVTGRSARGRLYIAGLSSALFIADANILSTAAAQDYADACAAAFGSLTGGWQHVILSRQNNGALRPFGIGYQVTNYLYTDTRVDTQRRRLPNA